MRSVVHPFCRSVKLIGLLAMLLPYSYLIAQSGIEEEGRTDPVMEAYRDSLQGWYDDHFPICAGPGLVSVTPIFYQNYVNFELVFNGAVDTSAIDLYTPGSPTLAYGTLQVLDTGMVLLKNIPLDLDLRLQWGHYCDSTLVKVDVSTSIPQNGDQIEVSDQVFSAVNEHKMAADSSLRLNQVIRNNAAISHYKKLHFFQNFYLGGSPYDQNFDEALPDQAYLLDKMRALGYNSDISLDHDGKPAESSASAKPCNCKVLLNQTQLLVPVSAKTLERSFRSDDSEIAGLWQNRQMHGGYHFNRGNFGPAMYAHLVTTGHKVAGERNEEFGSTKTPEKAGTRIHASLIYHLICSDEQDIMEGCACRRVVRAG
jgi:hypothetical protein